MIYTDRKYLSILTLTEDRDYVTYDELIHVLTERPSDAVYIERDGILRGLIVSGDIRRTYDEKTRCVPFSKKYIYVHPEEYWRARQIFRDKMNICMLPVVSEDGRLLGDYTRWDDFISADYVELLCSDPYILQCLKENVKNAVIIKPVVYRGTNREELFMRFQQKLIGNGIRFHVIQHWELKNYNNVSKIFLYADENEKRGIETLNYLHHLKVPQGRTIIDYLYYMRQLASARSNESILKELQNQGIFILLFNFKENNNQFFAALNEKIKRRNKEHASHANQLHEELRESFLGELYYGAYKEQHFPLPISFHRQSGIPYLGDAETEFYHVRNGERLTVGQPEEYDRCIYVFGPCNIIGVYVSDQYTIPSFLQSEINQAGFSCKVVNRGFPAQALFTAGERLQSEFFWRGDIIVLDQLGSLVEDFPVLNLTDTLEKHDASVNWFVDRIRHSNHKANQVCADAIYEELVPVLQQQPGERTPVELNFDYVDQLYLSHYFSDFDHTGYRTVGSIVMNCNPFTLGHRFLIEEALKTVDFLVIFVVEEDESLFPFQERFAMVYQGTSDLENIMVVPSGPYILSRNTFPEYFEKINDEDLKKNTEDDITLFAENIAPKLGIKYRFVGEEREDEVTNEYNEVMKRILPRYGIQVVEIPRKANGRSVISASRVRQCLSENRIEELDELVPASTKRILFYRV